MGLSDGTSLHVTEYPAAWRVEVINDGLNRGFRWEPDIIRRREMVH